MLHKKNARKKIMDAAKSKVSNLLGSEWIQFSFWSDIARKWYK